MVIEHAQSPGGSRRQAIELKLVFVYQVDDSGKITRLRKACPTCGAGIFMATHFNRVYWYVSLLTLAMTSSSIIHFISYQIILYLSPTRAAATEHCLLLHAAFALGTQTQ